MKYLVFIPLLLYGCIASNKSFQYVKEVNLDRPLVVKSSILESATGGENSSPCLRGSYTHVYRAEGLHQTEVYLCCAPVSVILSESFDCNCPLVPHMGDSEYMKIRFCSILDPTATIPTYIPVCISAPLEAAENNRTTNR